MASYKFALLLSLADLSVEKADGSGDAMSLSSYEIAEKFIQYYWRQAAPYPSAATPKILQQNTGNQAEILNIIRDPHKARRLASADHEEGRCLAALSSPHSKGCWGDAAMETPNGWTGTDGFPV